MASIGTPLILDYQDWSWQGYASGDFRRGGSGRGVVAGALAPPFAGMTDPANLPHRSRARRAAQAPHPRLHILSRPYYHYAASLGMNTTLSPLRVCLFKA